MTIRDVARAAAVSTATVSRVLNGDPGVLAETAARVRAAVESLGYRPNHVARSLKTRATRTVGVVAPELASDFFMALADSMDRELASHGYGLIVCSSRESAEGEARRLEMLSERLVDGAVVIPATGGGAHLREARERGLPLVLVDRLVEGLDADAVLSDNEGGAYAATMALAGAGYRRLGFIGGGSSLSVARERLAGWERAMRDAGIPAEGAYVLTEGDLHVDSGYRAMRALLADPDSPDAYFVVNAYAHVGATNCLVSEGGPRAERIAFAAFDEMPYSPLLRFCRFSVSQPVAEIGVRAARLLLDRIGGEGPAGREILRLPTTLVARGVPRPPRAL